MALTHFIFIALLSLRLTDSRSLVDITTTVEPQEETTLDATTTETPETSTTAPNIITLDISR